MSEKEVCRYLELVDRRLFILVHSGIDWKPEYVSEMEAIDEELAALRELVEQEHEKRAVRQTVIAIGTAERRKYVSSKEHGHA